MSSLLPITDITPELLDEIARRFIAEDADHKAPEWWGAMCKASAEAARMSGVRDNTVASHAAMIMSAMELLENSGITFQSVGGIVMKCIVAGWRMAEMRMIGDIAGLERDSN